MRIANCLMMLAALSVAAQPVAAEQAKPEAKPAAAKTEILADEAYVPQDKDERGLWMQMENVERELKVSPLVMRDPVLNDYVRSVLCKTVGDARCSSVRLYILRTSDFNASMAPNGVLEVYSGLLLRTQNEAQLAAVLGHEYVHYAKRHSIQNFREIRSKTNGAVWLSMVVGGLLASLMMFPSIFKHSREMEKQSDEGGLALISKAGYDTREASKIWEQLREEMDATAAARKTKSKKDKDKGMFEDHPPTAERVAYLTEMAKTDPGSAGNAGAEAYARVMAPYRAIFLDDQIKQNDFGASEYLITSLGKQGWSPWLHFAHGELYRRRGGEGDFEKAAGIFSQGIAAGDSVPELWRARGLVELKMGKTDDGKADLKEYLKRAPDASDKSMIAMMAGG